VTLSSRFGEYGRIFAVTAIVSALYLALQQVWLALPHFLPVTSIAERPSAAELEKEARDVALASEAALRAGPASARHDVWQLGFFLGQASQFRGSFAMSAPDVQEKARRISEPLLNESNQLSTALGLGPVSPLDVRTIDDFARLTERIEMDESGLAERIRRAYSPYHRHLFLLGMHLGTESARIEGSKGALSLPPRAQIRRHATVAGIAPALWEPLAANPHFREQPAEVVARYRSGLTALSATLSAAPGK
jgi:hypothetical protein